MPCMSSTKKNVKIEKINKERKYLVRPIFQLRLLSHYKTVWFLLAPEPTYIDKLFGSLRSKKKLGKIHLSKPFLKRLWLLCAMQWFKKIWRLIHFYFCLAYPCRLGGWHKILDVMLVLFSCFISYRRVENMFLPNWLLNHLSNTGAKYFELKFETKN